MSKKLKLTALSVAVAGALSSGAALAEVTANISAVSNYYFRGQSLSGDAAAIQGGVDYAHESGLYVGTWASTLSGSNPSYELDLYVGFAGEAAGLSYDVGYVRYNYPDATDDGADEDQLDYGELYAKVGWNWLGAGIYYTTDSEADNSVYVAGDMYYFVSADFGLEEGWGVGGTYGYTAFEEDGSAALGGLDADYGHLTLYVSKETDAGTFNLNFEQTDIDPNDNYLGTVLGTVNSDKPKFWVGYSVDF